MLIIPDFLDVAATGVDDCSLWFPFDVQERPLDYRRAGLSLESQEDQMAPELPASLWPQDYKRVMLAKFRRYFGGNRSYR